ncbi:YrhK family protein [Oceanobacillus kimchii]|uniref:YrhK family protein n=1 Tax=Oceanobacillus kimchii TaxID=746691 RepID=UPI000346A023|nr:YrhK family protein [Oceanobacillus kimchii]MCT1578738.1 YrhK family protein [Oceanobacillus kimchii]MCT2136213.1 YrhK family protein [Oceanobacillus kimchii]
MQIPRIKNYKEGNKQDFSIYSQSLEVYFQEKYNFLQLIGDVLVGIFFVTGSILNFFAITDFYGNVAYLLGSLSLTIRPLLKILRKTWIYRRK